jgi:hypothetical protein
VAEPEPEPEPEPEEPEPKPEVGKGRKALITLMECVAATVTVMELLDRALRIYQRLRGVG